MDDAVRRAAVRGDQGRALPARVQGGDRRERAEVAAIAKSPEPPTFANTIEALDGAGEFLDRVQTVFYGQLSAETNDALQAVAKEVAPLLAALGDDISLDPALFARVKAVWETRDAPGLTAEQRKLVEETYKNFVRGGANLDADGQERLRAINKELSLLGLKFGDNVLKETNAYRLVIEKQDDLAGLPPGVVDGAAAAAKAAKLEGKWVFTLQAPSIWPFLQYADNRELRRQILTAYITRCDHGDASDNKAILAKIAALRAEKAKLLGYPTWANFVLESNMAKTPDKVYGLLDQLWTPALAVAHQEAADLQASIRADGKEFKLEPWDWRYYAEKVKKARYDFDEEALRPYFKLDNVRDGAFYVANKLYGLTFIERTDIPKYHPEVRTFEVKDADGSHLGVFMIDYHPRPGKRGGAWSGRYRDQWFKDGKDMRPIVVNVCNFSRPAGDAPALLSLEEAETLFHEFGHGLHSLLSRVHYHGLARVPARLRRAAVADHGELGAGAGGAQGVRQALEDRRRHPGRAGREDRPGAQVQPGVRHRRVPGGVVPRHGLAHRDGAKERDATAFENAAMAKIHMMPEIVVRYRSPYFSHIFGPGAATPPATTATSGPRCSTPTPSRRSRRRGSSTRRRRARSGPTSWSGAAPTTRWRCTCASAAASRASSRCSPSAA